MTKQSVWVILEYSHEYEQKDIYGIYTSYESCKKAKPPMYVSGTQLRRMRRLVGQVDYIITDSPLLVSCLYVPSDLRAPFEQLLAHYHTEFENINFVVERVKKYEKRGRNQTEEQAKALDWEVGNLPVPTEEGITSVPGNGPGVHMVLAELGLG